MKKAPALITIAVIALVTAGVVYLSRNNQKTEIDGWQLVPATSIAVLETDRLAAVQKFKIDSLGLIDLLIGLSRSKGFSKPHLFCFQSTGKLIGWAVVLPRGFRSPLDTLASMKIAVNQRSYEGRSLYEARKGNKAWATFANVDGIWIASCNSLLVEEIVRQSRKLEDGFRKVNRHLFNLSTVKQDDGNLYLNWSAAASFFLRSDDQTPLKHFSHSMVIDLKWNEGNLQGNGFAVDTAELSTALSIFTGQKPVPFELRKSIPDQFTSAVHFGFSDAASWFANRDKVYSAMLKTEETPSVIMEKAFGFRMDEFVRAVDDEMMICRFADGGEVVVVELKEITRGQTLMDKIRRASAGEKENYADRVVYTVKKENAFAPVMWPIDFRAPETHYSFDQNLLILSTGREWIKRFIDLQDREQTVGKSISWSKFLESTLAESNVSFIANNTGGAISARTLRLPGLSPIDKASLQFYALKGNYYSSASIQFGGDAPRKIRAARPDLLTINLTDPVLSGPWTVFNHQERRNEIMVQDNASRLWFLGTDGNVRWTKDLKGRITTDIKEIDYLKNGKIQYLFCTPGTLHLVDRLGKDVKGFPRNLEMGSPRWLSVVDYNKDRKYRIVVADDAGMIFILDKEGKALDGWNPKSVGSHPFVDAPTHYRIAQKDYYVAVTTDGVVQLFSRRGEIIKPFPVKNDFVPSGDVYCDATQISLVSEGGSLIKLSSAGKKEFDEPILKNVTAANFRLIASDDRTDFIVTRTERGNFAVFDQSGKMKFEIVNPLSDKIDVRYYRATSKSQLIVVRDTEQGLVYALDGTGKILTAQPIPASQSAVADLGEEGVARLIICEGNTLSVLKLPFR